MDHWLKKYPLCGCEFRKILELDKSILGPDLSCLIEASSIIVYIKQIGRIKAKVSNQIF